MNIEKDREKISRVLLSLLWRQSNIPVGCVVIGSKGENMMMSGSRLCSYID